MGADILVSVREGRTLYPERDDAPEPDLAGALAGIMETCHRADGLMDIIETAAQAVRDGEPPPDDLGLVAIGLRHYAGQMHEVAGAICQVAARKAAADAGQAFAAAKNRGRHRAARQRPRRAAGTRKPGEGQLALVSDAEVAGESAELLPSRLTPAALSGLSGVSGLKLAALTAGAAASVAVAAPAIMSGSASGATVPPSHHSARAFAGVAPVTALPLIASPRSSYTPRHAKATSDAASATAVPPPPVVTVSPSPSPTASAPVPQPQMAVGGALDVQTAQCTAGANGTCMVVFEAVGGALQWSATSSDPAVTLDRSGGILGDGQSIVLTVTVARGTPAGSATITVTAGSQQETIPVTWDFIPG